MNAQASLATERAQVRGSPNPYPTEKPVIETELDRALEALWCYSAADASQSVTLAQLREARSIDDRISAGSLGRIRFKIIASRHLGTFCLGGDLSFFAQCIERMDRAALAEYAVLAAKAIWSNASGLAQRGLKSLALVQGEAQGGGFEAALSCNTLIAEEGATFGFPEPLFGMFPGMGGQLLLETRVDASVAARMVKNSNRYSAEFLHKVGVVDYLCPKGAGLQFATALMNQARGNPQGETSIRMNERQQRLDALTYGKLAESIERWVARAFTLEPRHLRSMRYIVEMQQRKAGQR